MKSIEYRLLSSRFSCCQCQIVISFDLFRLVGSISQLISVNVRLYRVHTSSFCQIDVRMNYFYNQIERVNMSKFYATRCIFAKFCCLCFHIQLHLFGHQLKNKAYAYYFSFCRAHQSWKLNLESINRCFLFSPIHRFNFLESI